MGGDITNQQKKEKLKAIIKKLHEGADLTKLTEEFKALLEHTSPTEIAQIEEKLIEDGLPQEEIHKLCDIHIALFRDTLEKTSLKTPAGHPLSILVEEHKLLLKHAEDLKNLVSDIESHFTESVKNRLTVLEKTLKNSESHYVREENVLFPYLEKHGITQPPAIMWTEHNAIREVKKNIYTLIGTSFMDKSKDVSQFKELSTRLAESLANHFYKENNILFPAALQVIAPSEWNSIRKEFDELGYCPFTPEEAKIPFLLTDTGITQVGKEGVVVFETGSLSYEEVEMILNNLPLDVTFVDKDDTVRYFSQTRERIFPRTKAVIGRKVQQCHPEKSIHVVNQILDDFKHGRRDRAEFWITMNDMVVYIRYFPVRNRSGEYLGCLEVTQNIAPIKKIEGEKRLL